MTKPITPQEALQGKSKFIPEFVMEAFNELITKNFDGKTAIVSQKEVVDLIITKCPEDIESYHVFNEKWLDIEQIYVQSGWEVEYDKPGYNETYQAKFIFRKGN